MQNRVIEDKNKKDTSLPLRNLTSILLRSAKKGFQYSKLAYERFNQIEQLRVFRFYAYAKIINVEANADTHPLDAAANWYKLGKEYTDPLIKRLSYEETLIKNPKHAPALYDLAQCYKLGLGGLDASRDDCKKYLRLAAENGSEIARNELIQLEIEDIHTSNPKLNSASDWFLLAEAYSKSHDIFEAYVCYQNAYELSGHKHAAALNKMAYHESMTEFAVMNLDDKRPDKHYFEACKLGSYEAAEHLISLRHVYGKNGYKPYKFSNSDVWVECANENLTAAKQSVSLADRKAYELLARVCFDKCLTYSRKNANALYHLGLFNELGLGFLKPDMTKACEYYENAETYKHLPSIVRLLQINFPDLSTSRDWVIVSETCSVRSSEEYDTRAYISAMIAVELDPKNSDAHLNLAKLFERGCGVQQDLGKALLYYIKAADLGNAEAEEEVRRIKSDIETEKLYKNISWYLSWIFAGVSGPSQLAKHAALAALTPLADWLSSESNNPWIKTWTVYGIEGVSFLYNIPGYLVSQGVKLAFDSGAQAVEQGMQLRHPYVRTALRVGADVASMKLTSLIQKGIDEEEEERALRQASKEEMMPLLEEGLKQGKPYFKDEDGQLHVMPERPEDLYNVIERFDDVSGLTFIPDLKPGDTRLTTDASKVMADEKPGFTYDSATSPTFFELASHKIQPRPRAKENPLSLVELLDSIASVKECYDICKAIKRGHPSKENYIGAGGKHSTHIKYVGEKSVEGIRIVFYHNTRTNKYIVAFPGTDFTKWDHASQTLATALGSDRGKLVQQMDAEIRGFENKHHIKFSLLVGFSQGGFYATHSSYAQFIPQVTFDAHKAKGNELAVNLATYHDFASNILSSPGRYIYVCEGDHAIDDFDDFAKHAGNWKNVFTKVDPKRQDPSFLKRLESILPEDGVKVEKSYQF